MRSNEGGFGSFRLAVVGQLKSLACAFPAKRPTTTTRDTERKRHLGDDAPTGNNTRSTVLSAPTKPSPKRIPPL